MRAFFPAIVVALPMLTSCGLACCCISASAQPAPQNATSLHEISGVVLNARTGLPIRDAEVTVRRTKDSTLLAQVATDSEGRFSVPQLPGDKYSLQASHRGYIAAAYDEHESGSTAIVTGEGLISTGLRFMLAPQGVIFGIIADDSGDPVPNATVSLYRLNPGAGPGKMVHMRGAGSDELGNYEISHLPPGSYFLCVTATPWYASRRQSQNGNPVSPGNQARSPLDVAYPATYYPDAADSNFAAPIAVAAGERVPINVTLHPVPAIHITMQLPAGPNGQFSIPQLHREIFGNPDAVQTNVSSFSGRGSPVTVEISGIAPGAYEMELNSPNGESSRVAAVDLNSDQAIDLSSAASSAVPLVEVSGKVAMASGEAPPSSLYVMLTPQQSEQQIAAPIEPDGSFHLRSMHPGTYEFSVHAFGYPMTTTHLTAAGASLKGHLLTIGSEPVTLTAILADSTASVNGFATRNGKPASGIFLELIPKNAAAGRAAFAVNQSDSDGSFNFLHILPGEYTLVAIQEGWTLDWASPEAMAPYLAKGLRVLVPPHSQEINLKDSVEVQPK